MTAKTLANTATTLIFASAGVFGGAAIQSASAADTVRGLTYSQDPVSGYVEAYGGIGNENDNGSTFGFTRIGGAGRLNWWLSPAHSLQVDVQGNAINFDGSEGDQSMGLAAHYAWRMPTGNLAVMGSIGQEDGTRYTTLAVEGQLSGMNWTLYGQGGVTRETADSDHVPYVMVQGRYFFQQNFEASADVTLADYFGRSASQFGAALEYRPMGMPFSVFGRGQVATFSCGGNCKDTFSEALFGIKLFVGPQSQTLWMNSVNGATYVDGNPVYGEFSVP